VVATVVVTGQVLYRLVLQCKGNINGVEHLGVKTIIHMARAVGVAMRIWDIPPLQVLVAAIHRLFLPLILKMKKIGTIDLSGLYLSSFFENVEIFYNEDDAIFLFLNEEMLQTVIPVGETKVEEYDIEDVRKLINDYFIAMRPRPDSGFVHS
jgi:hypothetical protein